MQPCLYLNISALCIPHRFPAADPSPGGGHLRRSANPLTSRAGVCATTCLADCRSPRQNYHFLCVKLE